MQICNCQTHLFNGPLSGTTRVSRYQKGKPIWILLKQETVSGSGISWVICKSAPCSRQITTPAPHHSVFLPVGCLSCRPTNSVKALKAIATYFAHCRIFQQCAYRISFPHKLASSTAILILFVILLPISNRFRYLDHLVANSMAPSMCPDPRTPVERDGVLGFKQFWYNIFAYYCHMFGTCAIHSL